MVCNTIMNYSNQLSHKAIFLLYLQPSRNKEEFRELASDFHLRWNFLLRTISKAMTLNDTDSFGK